MIFSNKIIGKNINLIILKIFLWLFHSFNLINEILILLILKKTIVYFFILHSFFWQWHKNETDIEKTKAYQWKMIRFLKIYNLVQNNILNLMTAMFIQERGSVLRFWKMMKTQTTKCLR